MERKIKLDSAIHTATKAIMASALSAGSTAQMASVMTAPSAPSPISLKGARMARLTGESLAPRIRMEEELESSQDADLMRTWTQDCATISAQLAIAAMAQSAGKNALQVPAHVAPYARLQEKIVQHSLRMYHLQQLQLFLAQDLLLLLLPDFWASELKWPTLSAQNIEFS